MQRHKRRKLRVSLQGGGGGGRESFFFRLLSQEYDVEIVKGDEPSDLHFYVSEYEQKRYYLQKLRKKDCIKVFETGENHKPNFRIFDYALSYGETDGRNLQFPGFATRDHFEQLKTGRYSAETDKHRNTPKTEFCNFVYNSPHKERMRFPAGIASLLFPLWWSKLPRQKLCEKLMRYKRVDCPSRILRNMPSIGAGKVEKLNFINRYKFTIAAERESAPHYVTEKIFEALLVNSVPIYWGCPEIAEYFNPEAFINCHDYDDFDGVVRRIIEVDKDDELYRRYAEAPPVLEGSRLHDFTRGKVIERLDKIVTSIGAVKPVSTTFPGRMSIFWNIHLAKMDAFLSRNLWAMRRGRLAGLLKALRR